MFVESPASANVRNRTDYKSSLPPDWWFSSQEKTTVLRSPLPRGRGLLPCRRLRRAS